MTASSPSSKAAPGIVFAAALVLLSACGRQGPLEPPSAAVIAPQTTANGAQTTQTVVTKSGGTTTVTNPNPPPPDKPFVLDPLLR